MQVTPQWNQSLALEFDEAAIASEFRECARVVLHHILGVEGLEISIPGGVKQEQNRHHFRAG
ncbi:MAG: hypothetical protein LC778_21300 [Acidobacteria bacterium]|nr:hypothetical protein [Acidobacteriota bacterium]